MQMGVDFTWENTKQCSKTSPEIRVYGVPADVKFFKVKLVDLDSPSWNHGGGIFPNDGSGIIPAGSLKKGYNGPCPPIRPHKYRFTVKGLDSEGKVVAEGKHSQKFSSSY